MQRRREIYAYDDRRDRRNRRTLAQLIVQSRQKLQPRHRTIPQPRSAGRQRQVAPVSILRPGIHLRFEIHGYDPHRDMCNRGGVEQRRVAWVPGYFQTPMRVPPIPSFWGPGRKASHLPRSTKSGVPSTRRKGQRIRYRKTAEFHFLTFSCYRRRPYFTSAAAMDLFEDALERVRLRYLFVVAGYVVMPEHVHLLINEPRRALLSTAIQALKLSVSMRRVAPIPVALRNPLRAPPIPRIWGSGPKASRSTRPTQGDTRNRDSRLRVYWS